MWCLNEVSLDQIGASKCGATIRWKPMSHKVKKFTSGRIKEIEVYLIHLKGAEGKMAVGWLSSRTEGRGWGLFLKREGEETWRHMELSHFW